MQKVIRVFTDGACSLRTGKGSWAAMIDTHDSMQFLYGLEDGTTNQRTEVLAAIQGLQYIHDNVADYDSINVYTDSMYLKNGITTWIYNWIERDWLKRDGEPIKNKDLWARLLELTKGKEIRWIWVKGHSGNVGNSLVDAIAEYSLNNLEKAS